jgi:alanyl-tRNA synthetase
VVGVTPISPRALGAVDLVKVASNALGGKGGGGRPRHGAAGALMAPRRTPRCPAIEQAIGGA